MPRLGHFSNGSVTWLLLLVNAADRHPGFVLHSSPLLSIQTHIRPPLLGSLFRLPFSWGGCCCKSLLSECWSVLGQAASLVMVVVVMHPGAGCVCRRYGHASSLALPGLVSLSDDSLLKIGNLATHSLALSIIITMHCCHFVLLLAIL